MMTAEFDMSMVGELSYFLGFQIKQLEEGMFLSQEKYAKNLVKKFGMDTAKSYRTPISPSTKITKDVDVIKAYQGVYRSMIGSLLYLTASRPDISYVVGVCARYQADPRV